MKVRLTLDTAALARGQTSHLAVLFDIDKGWHLYWRNPGDSGLPPKITFKLPPGLTIGEPQWPAPERHVEPGGIVDYVYHDQLALIYPITASATLNAATVPVEADVDFLVCSKKCVPGRTTVRTVLAVVASSSPSADAALFARFHQRMPRQADKGPAPFRAAWKGQDMIIESDGATRLAFFPYRNEADVYPEELPASQSTILRLRYPSEARGAKDLRGVLAIEQKDSKKYLEITLPVLGERFSGSGGEENGQSNRP